MTQTTPNPAPSATLEGVTARAPESYGARWRAVPRELLFHAPTIIIVTIAFGALTAIFSVGTSLLSIFVGIFVLALSIVVARFFGEVELRRLELAGMPSIARPRWKPPHHDEPVATAHPPR